MRFTKMQGAGNDYIYIDCFRTKPPLDPASLSRKLSDRHFGVGGDGLILICPSERADARMWLSDDDRRIMLALQSKFSFGQVTLKLKEYADSAAGRP